MINPLRTRHTEKSHPNITTLRQPRALTRLLSSTPFCARPLYIAGGVAGSTAFVCASRTLIAAMLRAQPPQTLTYTHSERTAARHRDDNFLPSPPSPPFFHIYISRGAHAPRSSITFMPATTAPFSAP